MTKKMRAVRQHEFGGPEVLTFEEIDVPKPLPTEVQVEVYFAGVNPVDAKVRVGASAAVAMVGFPFRVGWDFAGVVSEVGVGVTRFQPGDRVFGMPRFPRESGSYAEYLTAPSRQLVKVPESIDIASAAAVPLPATTAWQGLVDVASVEPGQTVVVLGASGAVGGFVAQIAKSLGATVIGTARSQKVDYVRGLGVDRVVDTDRESLSDVIQNADVAIDLIGGDFSSTALELVRPGGLVISVPSGDKSALQAEAACSGKRLTGFIVEPDRVALEEVSSLIEQGKLHVPEPVTMNLSDAVEIHQRLDQGAGKTVLRVKGDA